MGVFDEKEARNWDGEAWRASNLVLGWLVTREEGALKAHAIMETTQREKKLSGRAGAVGRDGSM